jgi:hypothetical protein
LFLAADTPLFRSIGETVRIIDLQPSTTIMIMRTLIFFSFIIALSLQMGCRKDRNRPEDLPKLYPVSITVTQESKPLEGATVTLHAKTPTKYGTCTAVTDATGVASLQTYTYAGAPIGQYAVTVGKRGVEGAKETTNEYGETITTGGKIYQYIDGKYGNETNTPFSIDVTESGASESFEVGAPVKIHIGDVAG